MIVMFTGGGPAKGMYKNFPDNTKELRVATTEMVAEGMCALYEVTEASPIGPEGKMAASAVFRGTKPSAASLLDMIVENPDGD
jgi:hypothetical protein